MFKIEADTDQETYQLVWQTEGHPDYIEGYRVDFGIRSILEKDGEHYFALIDSEGQSDAKVYKDSDGIDIEIDTDWDFTK